jgi:hypothetical protein
MLAPFSMSFEHPALLLSAKPRYEEIVATLTSSDDGILEDRRSFAFEFYSVGFGTFSTGSTTKLRGDKVHKTRACERLPPGTLVDDEIVIPTLAQIKKFSSLKCKYCPPLLMRNY